MLSFIWSNSKIRYYASFNHVSISPRTHPSKSIFHSTSKDGKDHEITQSVSTGWLRKGLLFLPHLLPKITLLNPRIIEQKATQQDFLTEEKKKAWKVQSLQKSNTSKCQRHKRPESDEDGQKARRYPQRRWWLNTSRAVASLPIFEHDLPLASISGGNHQWLFQLVRSTQFRPVCYTFWLQLLITGDEPAWDRARDVINHEVLFECVLLGREMRNSPMVGTPNSRQTSASHLLLYHTLKQATVHWQYLHCSNLLGIPGTAHQGWTPWEPTLLVRI